MNVLGFQCHAEVLNGRRVRRAEFRQRSSLPVSAACVVANGVRETLASVLRLPVSLRLLEPVIPNPAAWRAICAGARIYGVRGAAADAVFVLRPADALALAAALFGEVPGDLRALSPLENEMVTRALSAVSGCLSAVCGRDAGEFAPILDIHGYAAYFELLFERPAALRLGVALSAEPPTAGGSTIRIGDLMDVELEVKVEFARGNIDGAAVLDLRPGTYVPMKTRVGERGLLKLGTAVLARGQCGVWASATR